LVIGVLGAWAHPAEETALSSKNTHPSGQANGWSLLAFTRQRSTTSPAGVLRRK